MDVNNLFNEDCKETMRKMEENSIPFIITDPPYLLEFMGKDFDKQHKNMEGANDGQRMQKWHTEWLLEAYRVLKPGGFLVAFGGTRTSHRLTSAMEDAGFEIRDTLMWIYGSGFPKSLNIEKAINKRDGVEFEEKPAEGVGFMKPDSNDWNVTKHQLIQRGKSSDRAKKWRGWGTALKPAYEPIVIGMKPLSGSFVDNALNEGVAGINIDASRVATNPKVDDKLTGARSDGRFPANVILQHHEECKKIGTKKVKGGADPRHADGTKGGKTFHGQEYDNRIQENVGYSDKDGMETIEDYECHEDCPVRIMNEQSGNLSTAGNIRDSNIPASPMFKIGKVTKNPKYYDDTGGAARFYYTAKASKSERNVGLEGNYHPTVKPIDLMRYLVNMFSTPDGGIVYDPFAGSGSTLIACIILDRPFIGSELEKDYYEIAKNRLKYDWKNWWLNDKKDDFTKIKKEIKDRFWE